MEIVRIIEEGITTLSLKGNLLGEKDATPILDSMTISLENESNQFVVNLEEMKYINSSGLSVLITILTKSRNAGGDMTLVNLPTQLVTLLNITKLTEVFPQAGSIEEAKSKFKN